MVDAVLLCLQSYAALGALFAAAFAAKGASAVVPGVQGSLGFRLMLLPGATLLWPWLAYRWIRGPL